jgi:hypothetical protein
MEDYRQELPAPSSLVRNSYLGFKVEETGSEVTVYFAQDHLVSE